MKKHLNKLIIAIAFMLVLAATIVSDVLTPRSVAEEFETQTGNILDIPKDYEITESINVLVNEDNYIHTDETTVRGTLKDIVYAGINPNRLIISLSEDDRYTILFRDLELISTEIIKTKKEHGLDEVHLAFRTGGAAALTEGDAVTLYKNPSGVWSIDVREHQKSSKDDFFGVVEDFKFLPTTDQNGEVYISHIIVKNQEDETVRIYPHNLEASLIKSHGNMTVYYAGNILSTQVFDIRESDDFALDVRIEGKVYVLKKGEEIHLKQTASKGYWELADEIDQKLHEAIIESFDFGFRDTDITSVDYINLVTDTDEKVQLTMMQLGAVYAIPYGNYQKIFAYEGHDKNLVDIVPMDDWYMKLYYKDGTVKSLGVGTKLWIYKNEDNIWVVDYKHEEEDAEADT